MSFENLDTNYKKVAKQKLKSDQRVVEDSAQEEGEDKEKYESTLKDNALSGLLQVFQSKLKNKNSDSEGDENTNFDTISFSNKNLYVKQESSNSVSEKEIEKLINNNIELPNTKKRYDQKYTPIHNVPSASDINPVQAIQPTNQSSDNQEPLDVNRMSDEQVKEKIAEHKKKKKKEDAN